MTRIGLLSDVHATPGPVREALQIFRDKSVDTILCAGDIAGYGNNLEQTVDLLQEHRCRSVAGNHDLWYLERDEVEKGPAAYLGNLSVTLSLEIVATSLLMVHASPPFSVLDGIKLLDKKGVLIAESQRFWSNRLQKVKADVLVVGHTHQVFAEQLGHLLVINPGSTVFNHTCAVLSLPEKSVEFFPLSGKKPALSWNFSMFRDSMLGN